MIGTPKEGGMSQDVDGVAMLEGPEYGFGGPRPWRIAVAVLQVTQIVQLKNIAPISSQKLLLQGQQ